MEQRLSLRSIVTGASLSMLMAMSAVYLALRMNAFYWASILTSLLSVMILKLLARLTKSPTQVHEVNLTQSMASAGGILAAGICFTFPALFFLNPELFGQWIAHPVAFSVRIFLVAAMGGTLGVILSAYLRRPMIVDEELPFPTGIAAADTIQNITAGTKKVWYLLSSFFCAAIFTALRDGMGSLFRGVIPFFIGISTKGFNLQIGFIPMTVGGGYLVGFATAITWLSGCLISNWLYQPVLVNVFAIPQEILHLNYVLPIGVGIVVGSGLFIFVKTILPSMKRTLTSMFDFKKKSAHDELSPRWIPVAIIAGISFLTLIFKIHLVASVLAILGLWLMTVLASRMTGETNIDPMEILAVIVVVLINLFIRLTQPESIIVAGLIAVAVGVAADLLFDLKAGHLLGTSPLQLARAQLIGVLVSSTVVGASLISLLKVYTLGSPELFALQSQIVAFMIGHINWWLFSSGLLAGVLITLLGFSGLAFGVGVFIPMFFSVGFAIGGIFKRMVEKKYPEKDEAVRLVSAGLIGGEGVSGSILAFLKMLF